MLSHRPLLYRTLRRLSRRRPLDAIALESAWRGGAVRQAVEVVRRDRLDKEVSLVAPTLILLGALVPLGLPDPASRVQSRAGHAAAFRTAESRGSPEDRDFSS